MNLNPKFISKIYTQMPLLQWEINQSNNNLTSKSIDEYENYGKIMLLVFDQRVSLSVEWKMKLACRPLQPNTRALSEVKIIRIIILHHNIPYHSRKSYDDPFPLFHM